MLTLSRDAFWLPGSLHGVYFQTFPRNVPDDYNDAIGDLSNPDSHCYYRKSSICSNVLCPYVVTSPSKSVSALCETRPAATTATMLNSKDGSTLDESALVAWSASPLIAKTPPEPLAHNVIAQAISECARYYIVM